MTSRLSGRCADERLAGQFRAGRGAFSDEDSHAESLALLMDGTHVVCAHAFLETFSTLTGGKMGVKVDADFAAKLLSETILPRVQVIELNMDDGT